MPIYGVMAAILHWLMSERPVKRFAARKFLNFPFVPMMNRILPMACKPSPWRHRFFLTFKSRIKETKMNDLERYHTLRDQIQTMDLIQWHGDSLISKIIR
jgi:hypothetical protein